MYSSVTVLPPPPNLHPLSSRDLNGPSAAWVDPDPVLLLTFTIFHVFGIQYKDLLDNNPGSKSPTRNLAQPLIVSWLWGLSFSSLVHLPTFYFFSGSFLILVIAPKWTSSEVSPHLKFHRGWLFLLPRRVWMTGQIALTLWNTPSYQSLILELVFFFLSIFPSPLSCTLADASFRLRG